MILKSEESREVESIQRENEPTTSFAEREHFEPIKFGDRITGIAATFVSLKLDEVRSRVRDKETVQNLIELGDIHLFRNEAAHARKIYKNAIAKDPSSYQAYNKVILSSIMMKDFNAANDYHIKLLEISNRRADLLLNYVFFRLFWKQLELKDEILSDLKEILSKETENLEALNTYGFVLINSGELEESKKYFDKVLNKNPNYIHSINNIGVYYARKGDIVKAKKQFNKAIELNYMYSPSYENIANIFFKKNDYEGAFQYLRGIKRKGVKLLPPWLFNYGWLAIKTKHFELAKEVYEEYLRVKPNDPYALNNLGFCYYCEGKRDIAEKYFLRSISAQPENNLIPYYNLARISIEIGDLGEVKRISNIILKQNPNDPIGQYILGRIYLLKNRFNEAKEIFCKVLKEYPDTKEVYSDLGFILLSEDKDYYAAIDLLNNAIKRKLGSKLILNNLAYAYLKLNDIKNAKKIITLIKAPYPAYVYATKGLLAIKTKQTKKGKMLYSKAIKLFPDDRNRTIAKQCMHLAEAELLIENGEKKKAKNILTKALKAGKTYVNAEIMKLMKKHGL